jgi:hypothetical protein
MWARDILASCFVLVYNSFLNICAFSLNDLMNSSLGPFDLVWFSMNSIKIWGGF